MKIYRNILVAIDVSDEADQVLRQADKLAQINGAELSVVHVAPSPAYYVDFPYYPGSQSSELCNEADMRKILFEAVDKKAEPLGITKGAIDIRFGYAADEIIAKAECDNADLIVIGSHGRHGIRLLLGSTANAVLHRANCDVLAVRISPVKTP